MSEIGKNLIAIFSGIMILAIIAVIVGKNAQTTQVLGGLFTGLGSVIKAADGPVL